MTINLTEIYAGLKAYRDERGLTAQNQKAGYIVNIMEEFGELAVALRLFEKYTSLNDSHGIKSAEHFIIDALCDIAVFTINAGASIPCYNKATEIKSLAKNRDFTSLFSSVAEFNKIFSTNAFNGILNTCAILCKKYGFNFEIAMLETIKEISSRTGKYDESAKKFIKDESDEAKTKWYKADYEKARIEKNGK